jgi:uncharacterized glyoxalase superfamily protein PhnB
VDSTPILPVVDMKEAIAFYERAGFAVEEHGGGGYAFVSSDDRSVFDLTVSAAQPAHSSTCYLTVPDVEAWHERLTQAQLEVGPLEDKPWGMREFALVDHDGNCLRVGQAIDDTRL